MSRCASQRTVKSSLLRILDIWVNRRTWKTLKQGYIGTDCPETLIYTSNSVLFAVPIRKGKRTNISGLECECFYAEYPKERVCIYILGARY